MRVRGSGLFDPGARDCGVCTPAAFPLPLQQPHTRESHPRTVPPGSLWGGGARGRTECLWLSPRSAEHVRQVTLWR